MNIYPWRTKRFNIWMKLMIFKGIILPVIIPLGDFIRMLFSQQG